MANKPGLAARIALAVAGAVPGAASFATGRQVLGAVLLSGARRPSAGRETPLAPAISARI